MLKREKNVFFTLFGEVRRHRSASGYGRFLTFDTTGVGGRRSNAAVSVSGSDRCRTTALRQNLFYRTGGGGEIKIIFIYTRFFFFFFFITWFT